MIFSTALKHYSLQIQQKKTLRLHSQHILHTLKSEYDTSTGKEQMNENSVFLDCVFPKLSIVNKCFYWSCSVTVFYSNCASFKLNYHQTFDIVLFNALECSGQCLIAQTFFWHVERMSGEKFKNHCNQYGSIYNLLTEIIKKNQQD